MSTAGPGTGWDHVLKLLIIGDSGVGKSSLLLRFSEDEFDDAMPTTIGVDFKVKSITVEGKNVKLTLWDTAGQERFRTLTSSYYRGAHGIILMYDVTRPDSFESLEHWLQELDVYTPGGAKGVVKLLVGNKIDLEHQVARDTAEAWARRKGMIFLETSAKSDIGVKQAFDEVVRKIFESPTLLANTTPGAKGRMQLKAEPPSEGRRGCGC